jgi:putative flippase GtrA
MQRLWSIFDAILPAPLRTLLSPIIGTPQLLRQFVTYGSISVTALVLDLITYRFMIEHVIVPLALATGFTVSVTSHFSLNKYVTFRSHARPVAVQLRTYLIITGLLYVIALTVVETAIHAFHWSAMAAKLLSIPVTIPFGYLANKHLIFGPGVTATIARLRKRGKTTSA